MGNGFSYEQVEYQSGASRMLNSIFMAICVAPLLILGMCVMLGWNEQRAVCDQKAISAGRDAVQKVGCNNPMAGSGSLILFSCDIDAGSLPMLSFPNAGDFSAFQRQATGIEVDSSMYQCIESSSQRTEKLQGGGTRTITTYSYSLGWKSDAVSSGEFGTHSPQARDAFNRGPCRGRQNPGWNYRAPKTATMYASQMKVGSFITTMTDRVPIDTPVSFRAPIGWQPYGTGSFYLGQASYPVIGDIKLRLKSNNPSNLKATLLGRNDDGMLNKWTAPSSWLCSGFTLGDLRMGTISTDSFFNQLASEATEMTWTLRLVGFIVMWIAFCLCFGPLGVAGDCIPCIGPCVGDSIAAISCCVACLPATACTLGVAGVVWVAMRPLIGIPLMLAFAIIVGAFGFYIAKQKATRRGRVVQAQAPNMATPMTQPMATPMAVPPQMQVQAPMGSYPGGGMMGGGMIGGGMWNPNAICDGLRAEERAVWLQQNQGLAPMAAEQQVMREFPAQFGGGMQGGGMMGPGCAPALGGGMWNPNAICDGLRAEERAMWLQQNQGLAPMAAQQQVMREFPAQFGRM